MKWNKKNYLKQNEMNGYKITADNPKQSVYKLYKQSVGYQPKPHEPLALMVGIVKEHIYRVLICIYNNTPSYVYGVQLKRITAVAKLLSDDGKQWSNK